jgi:hypothetical protein
MGEGLTRRRAGGAGGSPTTAQSDQIPSSSNPSSSSGKAASSNVPSSSGGRVAYDPRDFQDDAESNKMPRLTLMEEVLLLGLKDKAVSIILGLNPFHGHVAIPTCFHVLSTAKSPQQPSVNSPTVSLTYRATYHSGTTTSPTPYEDVS